LALRIESDPIDSPGCERSPFGKCDEVGITHVQEMPSWAPLGWRYNDKGQTPQPGGPRYNVPRRFSGVTVVSSNGRGGFEEHFCLLIVATEPSQRSAAVARSDVRDCKEVAAYAHGFNTQFRKQHPDAHPDELPTVVVAESCASSVLGSDQPQTARAGDAVLLVKYSVKDVQKFVFSGGEDFLEMPQALFHFSAWRSGGHEYVHDLQGTVADDGSVLLVDPCVLRMPKQGVLDLVSGGSTAETAQSLASPGPSPARFNVLHPRCGPTCKAFDPQRTSGIPRRMCGYACGLQGS